MCLPYISANIHEVLLHKSSPNFGASGPRGSSNNSLLNIHEVLPRFDSEQTPCEVNAVQKAPQFNLLSASNFDNSLFKNKIKSG